MSIQSLIVPLAEPSLPDDCIVFKHSTRCPVSSAAAAEVRSFPWMEQLYWINVVEQRELSNWIRDHYGTRHESPQLLVIRGGAVTKVLNHGEIRLRNLNTLTAL